MKNNIVQEAKKTGDPLLDVLLDSNNQKPIVLTDETGRRIKFEQVALIPIDDGGERKVYVILKPMDKVDGINDDEVVVFVIIEDVDGSAALKIEEDMTVARDVFNRFQGMIDGIDKRGGD